MTEFEHKSIKYRAGNMVGLTQFHVVRRLAPMLASMAPVMAIAKSGREPSEEDKMQIFVAIVPAMAQAFADMSDQDTNYVIQACCNVVTRDQGGEKWAPITAPSGAFMFEDIKADGIFKITLEVIKANLLDFFSLIPDLL